MQSGISGELPFVRHTDTTNQLNAVSKELHAAFNSFASSPENRLRGIVAGIAQEQLVPLDTIKSTADDFFDDLGSLDQLIKDDEAAYIILRRFPDSPDGFVAITYVPDTANVRQKMLFASTRLTLVRELGAERFRDTFFATTKEELTADGWRKHERHGELTAPLTEEERILQGVRDAEAEASRGTTSRSSHVSSGLSFPIATEALDSLRGLATSESNLVQLVSRPRLDLDRSGADHCAQRIDIPRESVELVSTDNASAADLASLISDSEPRYSFFRYTYQRDGENVSSTIFIYTCPSSSQIKERMLYASSRAGVIQTATNEAGLEVSKKVG